MSGVSTRRQALVGVRVRPDTHPGLWLDAYLDKRDDGAEGRTIHEAVQGKKPPEEYSHRFNEIRASFKALGDRCRIYKAKVQGRLVIGLGNKNVLEMGIRLDHTWGVPVLPGSALKGLASRSAHLDSEGEGWSRPSDPSKTDGGEYHQQLFGSVEGRGEVIFHDAWWIPDPEVKPLEIDVMTVHHPDYYQGNAAPTDMDSPNPVSFATAQGSFLVALELTPGADPSWLDAAEAILIHSLQEHGLGAKTNAGYGRIVLERELSDEEKKVLAELEKATKVEEEAREALGRYLERAALVEPGSAKGFVEELMGSPLDAAGRAEVADRVVQKLKRRFFRGKEHQEYVKNLFAMLPQGSD